MATIRENLLDQFPADDLHPLAQPAISVAADKIKPGKDQGLAVLEVMVGQQVVFY
jgi:hypothetical protein